jgi:hypothetical protein
MTLHHDLPLLAPQTPWQVFWKVDGFLKLAVGVFLLWSAS